MTCDWKNRLRKIDPFLWPAVSPGVQPGCYSIQEASTRNDVFNPNLLRQPQLNLPMGFTLYNSLDYDAITVLHCRFPTKTIARWNAYLPSRCWRTAEVRFAAYMTCRTKTRDQLPGGARQPEDERGECCRGILVSFTYSEWVRRKQGVRLFVDLLNGWFVECAPEIVAG